jgi:hypothetical protein
MYATDESVAKGFSIRKGKEVRASTGHGRRHEGRDKKIKGKSGEDEKVF